MRTPEEWAKYEWDNALMKTEDFIIEIQKDAYNQALTDVEMNVEAEIHESEGFKYPSIKWETINKLKKQ